MLLSVIIPMYNESVRVKDTVRSLTDVLNDSKYSYELIFSDDGSTDGSASIVSEYAQTHPEIRVLCSTVNRGKGAAVRAGMLAARGDIAVFTDCDLAYGADAVIRIADTLVESGCDAAIGSRAINGGGYDGYSALRRVVSKVYLRLLRSVAGLSHTDSQCGIKAFTASAASALFTECRTEGFAFDLEILLRADFLGLTVTEMPVTVLSHSQHSSKVRLITDSVHMLRDIHRIKRSML